MFRHALVALLLFCVVAPLQAVEPLRLGLNYPSTGNYKSEGLELRRGALLAHFGSIERLRAATPAQIAEVPGFGPRMAAELHAFLHNPLPPPETTSTMG